MNRLVMALAGLVLLVGNVWAENLINNGDFESGLDGWRIQYDATQMIETSIVRSGVNSLRGEFIGVRWNGSVGDANGWIAVNPGATYLYSGYFYVPSTVATTGKFSFHYHVSGNGGLHDRRKLTPDTFEAIQADIQKDTWIKAERKFVALGNKFRPMLLSWPNSTGVIYWDDLSLSKVRTYEENKVYYQNIIDNPDAQKETVREANQFFADSARHFEKDYQKAIVFLEKLETYGAWEQIAGCRMELGDYAGAKTASQEAMTKAISVEEPAEKIKELGQRSERMQSARVSHYVKEKQWVELQTELAGVLPDDRIQALVDYMEGKAIAGKVEKPKFFTAVGMVEIADDISQYEGKADCLLVPVYDISLTQWDEFMGKVAKTDLQIIPALDFQYEYIGLLKLIIAAKGTLNAEGEPIIHSTIIFWGHTNNIVLQEWPEAPANAQRILSYIKSQWPSLPTMMLHTHKLSNRERWAKDMKSVKADWVTYWVGRPDAMQFPWDIMRGEIVRMAGNVPIIASGIFVKADDFGTPKVVQFNARMKLDGYSGVIYIER